MVRLSISFSESCPAAFGQMGFVLDVLVQSQRDKAAAKRLLRKLMKRQGRAPRVMVTDKPKSYGATKRACKIASKRDPAENDHI